MKMLRDPYGRPVTSLRISVTNQCNLRCSYCHNEGEDNEAKEQISVEKIAKIASISSSYGIKKVKITGGEPLLRDDITEITSVFDSNGFDDISLSTNGTLLDKYAFKLRDSGLDRVNISLDTLDEEKYKYITGERALSKVISGIHAAISADFSLIKLNMVLLRDINESDVWDLIRFAGQRKLILQLIELLDFGIGSKYHADMTKIEDMLRPHATLIKEQRLHRRKKYLIDNTEVEVVRPIDNSEFCRNCFRLRMTSDGKLKPCLLRNDNLVHIPTNEDQIKEAFKLAASLRKPFYVSL